MRTIAASAAAASRSTRPAGMKSRKPCASRKGASHSKPHSSGLTTRFSSCVVSRVSHSYIQRVYHPCIILVLKFIRMDTGPIPALCRLARLELGHGIPDHAQQHDQRHEPLRDDAVKAPHLQNILLDVREIERIPKAA